MLPLDVLWSSFVNPLKKYENEKLSQKPESLTSTHLEVRMSEHVILRAILEAQMFKNCMALLCKIFVIKIFTTHDSQITFGCLRCSKSSHRWPKHMLKSSVVLATWTFKCCFVWAKGVGFAAVSQTMAGMGRLKRICKHTCRAACAVQETSPKDFVTRSGSRFPEKRCILEHQIYTGFLTWFCMTGAALPMTWSHFLWHAQYFRQLEWKNRQMHWLAWGCQLYTQLSLFEGSLAELLCFRCCPGLKLGKSRTNLRFSALNFQLSRTSRRIASFSNLQTHGQTDRQTDGRTDRQTDR